MTHTPLAARLGLWRLTRHPVTKRLYERAADGGVLLAQLDLFERPTHPLPDARAPPAGVALSVSSAAAGVPDRLADAPVAPGDLLVRAERDGAEVGHCCLSDRLVYVPELRRRLAVEGSYVWKLYVEPAERGRGVGTALVGRAVAAAAEALDVDRVAALIAPDNLPSRRAFAGLGFRPIERHTAAGVFGRERHRVRPLGPSE